MISRATCATQMDALGVNRQHISLILNHLRRWSDRWLCSARSDATTSVQRWRRGLRNCMAILAGEGATDHKADVIALRA